MKTPNLPRAATFVIVLAPIASYDQLKAAGFENRMGVLVTASPGVLADRKRHVLANGHGIKQRAKLEKKTESGSKRRQLALGHPVNALIAIIDFAAVGH